MPNINATGGGNLGTLATLAVIAALLIAVGLNPAVREALKAMFSQIRSLPAVQYLWGPPKPPTTAQPPETPEEVEEQKPEDNFDYDIFRHFNDG